MRIGREPLRCWQRESVELHEKEERPREAEAERRRGRFRKTNESLFLPGVASIVGEGERGRRGEDERRWEGGKKRKVFFRSNDVNLQPP